MNNNQRKKKLLEISKKRNISFLELNEDNVPMMNERVKCKCNKCGYKFITYASNLNRKKRKSTGCAKCNKCLEKTYEDYIKLSNNKNIIFLNISKNHIPKNVDIKTKIKCNICDYEWFSSYYRINKSNCPNCANQAKKTYEDYLKLDSFIFLDIENNFPKNAHTKTNVKCKKCNYIWETTYCRVAKKNKCPKCNGKIPIIYEDYIKLSNKKNISFINLSKENLPEKSNIKIKVKCNVCNYKWSTSYQKLKIRNCPKCSKKARITKDDYILIEKKKNIIFLELNDNFPKTTMHPTKIKCNNCNYEWNSCYDKFKNSNINCPNCTSSKGEKICRIIFENIFNYKFPKIRPEWLRNPKTNYPLELDGYCEELNLAFEYNGSQHYEKNPLFKSDLKYQIEKDKFKIKKCKERNIELVIIKQFDRFTINYITKVIYSKLNNKNISKNDILKICKKVL